MPLEHSKANKTVGDYFELFFNYFFFWFVSCLHLEGHKEFNHCSYQKLSKVTERDLSVFVHFVLLFSTFDMVRFIRLLQLRNGPSNVNTEVFHYLRSNFAMQWFQSLVIEKGCCRCEEQEVRPHRRAEAGDKRSIRSFWYWWLRYSERCHSSPTDFPSSRKECQIL